MRPSLLSCPPLPHSRRHHPGDEKHTIHPNELIPALHGLLAVLRGFVQLVPVAVHSRIVQGWYNGGWSCTKPPGTKKAFADLRIPEEQTTSSCKAGCPQAQVPTVVSRLLVPTCPRHGPPSMEPNRTGRRSSVFDACDPATTYAVMGKEVPPNFLLKSMWPMQEQM